MKFSILRDRKIEVIEAGDVTYEIFDIQGNLVGKQLYSELIPGKYKINMNLNEVESGIYFYSLINDNENTEIKKMILLR